MSSQASPANRPGGCGPKVPGWVGLLHRSLLHPRALEQLRSDERVPCNEPLGLFDGSGLKRDQPTGSIRHRSADIARVDRGRASTRRGQGRGLRPDPGRPSSRRSTRCGCVFLFLAMILSLLLRNVNKNVASASGSEVPSGTAWFGRLPDLVLTNTGAGCAPTSVHSKKTQSIASSVRAGRERTMDLATNKATKVTSWAPRITRLTSTAGRQETSSPLIT